MSEHDQARAARYPHLKEFMSQATPDQLKAYETMVADLESPVQEKMIVATQSSTTDCRIIHACLGISSESGEIMDVIKKLMAYGKPIDHVNLDEEFGDLMWYVQLYCNARNITIQELMAMNYAKLRVRYGNKFSEEACFNRDLTVERQNLEASQSAFRVQDQPVDHPERRTTLDAVGISADSQIGKTSTEQNN